MRFAIPSYKRSELIRGLTLKMLEENKVDLRDVDVFVSSKQEAAAYANVLGPANLVYVKPLKGIVEKFNFIHNYYPVGEHVVFVEDDIAELKIKTSENRLEKFVHLKSMAEIAFIDCRDKGTALWGISSNANPFYMKAGTSVGFKFVVANLFGFISTRDKFLQISQECKSDYERTLLYFTKYRAVVRRDDVCAITKNYKTKGGLQEIGEERARLEALACDRLVERFPHLVSHNEKKNKTSMYRELKMTTIRTVNRSEDLITKQRLIDAAIAKR